MVDFVEICNVRARKATIEGAKRIINSDKVCHSYSDLNFGVTFLEHSVFIERVLFSDCMLACLLNHHFRLRRVPRMNYLPKVFYVLLAWLLLLFMISGVTRVGDTRGRGGN